MKKGRSSGAMGYLISEDDHRRLLQLRDQVRLLAALSAPRHPRDDDEPVMVTVASLGDCFQRLSASLELITVNARWNSA